MNGTLFDILVPAATGGATAFFSWFFTKKKYEADVEQAKTTTTQMVQDTYQELVTDLKREISELKEQVSELRAERDGYERDMRIVKDALYELLDSTCQIDCEQRKKFPSKKVEEILEKLR